MGLKVVCDSAAKLFSNSEIITKNMFESTAINRWPELQPFTQHQLFYRAYVLKRIAELIDRDLTYLLPQWSYSASSLDAITVVRQLWPLCKARNVIIEQMLQDTVSSAPSSMPVLFINRIAAKQQQGDSEKTVFTQVLQ